METRYVRIYFFSRVFSLSHFLFIPVHQLRDDTSYALEETPESASLGELEHSLDLSQQFIFQVLSYFATISQP